MPGNGRECQGMPGNARERLGTLESDNLPIFSNFKNHNTMDSRFYDFVDRRAVNSKTIFFSSIAKGIYSNC